MHEKSDSFFSFLILPLMQLFSPLIAVNSRIDFKGLMLFGRILEYLRAMRKGYFMLTPQPGKALMELPANSLVTRLAGILVGR